MPNSERVLNRKVQVLIKIAPPPLFYFSLGYYADSENLSDLLKRESKILKSYKRGSPLPFLSPPG